MTKCGNYQMNVKGRILIYISPMKRIKAASECNRFAYLKKCLWGRQPTILENVDKSLLKKKNRNKESIFRIYVNILRILRCGKLL